MPVGTLAPRRRNPITEQGTISEGTCSDLSRDAIEYTGTATAGGQSHGKAGSQASQSRSTQLYWLVCIHHNFPFWVT